MRIPQTMIRKLILVAVISLVLILPLTNLATTLAGSYDPSKVNPRPTHENDHPYYEYLGTVVRLIPIIIVNSPPKGEAYGEATFTTSFTYSFKGSSFAGTYKISSLQVYREKIRVYAKDGEVTGLFTKASLDIYNVYVCNYINPDGCDYVDTVATLNKATGLIGAIIAPKKTTDQTYVPTSVEVNGVRSVTFDVRYRNTNKFEVDTRYTDEPMVLSVSESSLISSSSGFFYDGLYLHGSVTISYGSEVSKEMTYTFPPGCLWYVHPIGGMYSFKLISCRNNAG